MKTFIEHLNEAVETRVAWHGSPAKFAKFNGTEVFLSVDKKEALRYGGYLYEVEFSGKPKFEVGSIMVIKTTQIVDMKIISSNPNQKIYRT